MTWSFALNHGDFRLDGASYATVGGAGKLQQDLNTELLTPRGLDHANPNYGSLIDGGVRDDGTEAPGILGETDYELAVMRIEQEIRRVISNTQGRQTQRSLNDAYTFGKKTISPGETLVSVAGIEIIQIDDGAYVTVKITTAGNEQLNLTIPLGL